MVGTSNWGWWLPPAAVVPPRSICSGDPAMRSTPSLAPAAAGSNVYVPPPEVARPSARNDGSGAREKALSRPA